MESGEQELRGENDKLSPAMRRKIQRALKKQAAEFQAKIQAAEQRAIAAEAVSKASALDVNGSVSRTNSEIVESPSGGNGSLSLSPSTSHPLALSSSNGGITHPLSSHAGGDGTESQASMENSIAELNSERQNSMGQEHESVKERQRLENEVLELRKTKDTAVKQREEARAKFDEELSSVKEDAEQRVGLLTKANEKLEAQLLGAADQVAEAFTRMSATHDDMERISREGQEGRLVHSKLVTENESLCQELKVSGVALAEAQQTLQEKIKEIEEMAAARKTAQEGQEAAMSQLMHRLDEMEAAGIGQQAENLRELNEDKVQLLLREKDDLQRDLDTSGDAITLLQEEIIIYKQRLLNAEATPVNTDTRDIQDVDAIICGLKADNESLLEELRSQSAVAKGLQQEVEELHRSGQQENPSSLQEVLSLRAQLGAMGAAQQAAENQIKRLSVACSDWEQQVASLSEEVANARSNLDDAVKSRDEKYGELDAKFGRLQKRAKQRIQEVQKEKEEAENQLAAAVEKAAQAIAKQAALQDDLERAKFQSAEVFRALDAERQQLRVANIKLRDEVEDLTRTLDGKEHNLAESRRLASEKDQTALELTAALNEVEASHATALTDVKEKYRKVEENVNAQLADATLENSKMSDTISALQAELSMKESKFAELEAASSGEMVRLGASWEASKGELSRLESEHRKEQEVWLASLDKLQRRLEDSEKAFSQQEVAIAELRSQMQSELERQRQILGSSQADLSVARNETARVANELAEYKVRAYALLQKKEAALLAAKDSDLAAAQETALKDAKREALLAAVERDEALKSLNSVVSEYENKLSARDISVLDAEQRIRDLATKLEASKGQRLAEQDEWQQALTQVETVWRLKYDTMESNLTDFLDSSLKDEHAALLTDYSNLKGEFHSFRDLVDTMIEDKDKEIARILEDNASLQRFSFAQNRVQSEDRIVYAPEQPDPDLATAAIAEQQILLLARQQAQREEEVSQCRRHIHALQDEITDLEQENRLHNQQESLLKDEVRNLERAQKRGGVDMTYLKNVILKLLETGEVEALLPVVAMLLQFSPEELKRCNDTYNSATSNGTVAVDTSNTPHTFFSRLSFAGGN